MGRMERIANTSPAGTVFPDSLRLVCEILDQDGYPISGSMKIRSDDYRGLESLLGDIDPVQLDRFAAFGASSDGGIYAFWLSKEHDATSAPIVFFDSEGEPARIMARTFDDFLVLMAIGYDEIPYDDLAVPPLHPIASDRLVALARGSRGGPLPATGREITHAVSAEILFRWQTFADGLIAE